MRCCLCKHYIRTHWKIPIVLGSIVIQVMYQLGISSCIELVYRCVSASVSSMVSASVSTSVSDGIRYVSEYEPEVEIPELGLPDI